MLLLLLMVMIMMAMMNLTIRKRGKSGGRAGGRGSDNNVIYNYCLSAVVWLVSPIFFTSPPAPTERKRKEMLAE